MEPSVFGLVKQYLAFLRGSLTLGVKRIAKLVLRRPLVRFSVGVLPPEKYRRREEGVVLSEGIFAEPNCEMSVARGHALIPFYICVPDAQP